MIKLGLENKSIKRIVLILFIIYLSLLVYLVFLAPEFGRSDEHYRKYNLVPFNTINNFIKYGDYSMQITNILGNIVAFIPMGLLLPIISIKYKKVTNTLLFVLFSSFFIEIIQFEFSVGAFDVDDVILNTTGGLIGYFIFCLGFIALNKLYESKARYKK